MASPYSQRRSSSRAFLPPDPRVAEPYRFTPQLAVRVGVLAALALVIFAVLFLRLWALQVLSGDRYLNAAQNNQLRTVPLEAPRGSILDRAGNTIVSNVPGTAVQIWTADLPEEGRYAMLRRLSKVLRVPLPRLTKALEAGKDDPLTPILVKTAVHEDQVATLLERPHEFPGVSVGNTYLRNYENRALAAQVLGYVGRDLKGGARPTRGRRLPRRREDRQDRGRGGVRHVPPRQGGSRAAPGRLARRSAGRGPADRAPAGTARQQRAADPRRRAPARGRTGAARRNHGGSQQRLLQRERRRDHRARPARRGRARDGLQPDLQAFRVRRPRRSEEARAADQRRRREEAELPGAEPGRPPSRIRPGRRSSR